MTMTAERAHITMLIHASIQLGGRHLMHLKHVENSKWWKIHKSKHSRLEQTTNGIVSRSGRSRMGMWHVFNLAKHACLQLWEPSWWPHVMTFISCQGWHNPNHTVLHKLLLLLFPLTERFHSQMPAVPCSFLLGTFDVVTECILSPPQSLPGQHTVV